MSATQRHVSPLAAFIDRIGQGDVRSSTVGVSVRRAIAPLLYAGVIKEFPQGAGKVFRMCNQDAVARFAEKEFPAGLFWDGRDEVDATLKARDSKRGHGEFVLVTVRGARGVLRFDETKAIDIAALSSPPMGCASFFLGDRPPAVSGAGLVVLVENLRVFARHEEIVPHADMAIYTAGKLPQRVIDWLASPEFAESRFVHAGDYDPVGLREFERVYARLGDRVTLHVPANIEALFRHGNERLLLAQHSTHLRGLLSHPDPGCRQAAALIMETGRGLEQQALLATGDVE